MWRELLSDPAKRRVLARDGAHGAIFLLGCAFEVVAIIRGDLGLAAAGTTLFGVIGIARA